MLFGAQSPLLCEYEETLLRLGLDHAATVSVGGRVRATNRSKVVESANGLEGHAFVPCAFAPQNRQKLFDLARAAGLTTAPPLIDPTAVVASTCRIGSAGYINAGVVVGGMTMLGVAIFVNRSSNIGHHCLIGDFASIGPGVTLASNVKVGEAAVIGAGAVVQPGTTIGDGAVVSAGSVVRRDVPPNTVVRGHPAQQVRLSSKRTSVWENTWE